MELMHVGTQKIEAIKCYRTLTGQGLKESKDQVEKYWSKDIIDRMLNKVQEQMNNPDPKQHYALNSFSYDSLKAVCDFLESCK